MSEKRKKTSGAGTITGFVPGKKKKCSTFVFPEGYKLIFGVTAIM